MYIPTIGLEIHAELRTQSKMFCACPNDPDAKPARLNDASRSGGEPNVNTCPICLGHPGTLPVPNEEAIKKVIKVGLALGGVIAKTSHFDRKSYFYPDLPKGYQISQYEEPLVTGGTLRGIRITRIHLEEDTAKLVHERSPSEDSSGRPAGTLVDFNRAGAPLMELVTEPDVKNADEAVAFARELQRILRYLGASDADMEKGQMRVEANISLAPMGTNKTTSSTNDIREIREPFVNIRTWGTKVEVKNLNSFRAVAGAIKYELARQEKLLREGKKVVQETRGWDDRTGETKSQRSKESAHDYRYFPEPDIPPLDLSAWDLETLKRELPELPEAKQARFVAEFGMVSETAEFFADTPSHADFFEAAASELKAKLPITNPPAARLSDGQGRASYQLLINYFTSDLQGLLKERGVSLAEAKISPEHFAHFAALVDEGKLSSRLAKDLLREMLTTGEDPETLIAKSGKRLMGDAAELDPIVREIIAANPQAAEAYRSGKGNALQFLVGQGMAKTKGQASPEILRRLFEKALGA